MIIKVQCNTEGDNRDENRLAQYCLAQHGADELNKFMSNELSAHLPTEVIGTRACSAEVISSPLIGGVI